MKYLKLFEAKSNKTFEKINKSDFNLYTCGESVYGSDLHKNDSKDIREIQEEFIQNNYDDFTQSELNKLKDSKFTYEILSVDNDWFNGSGKKFLLIGYCYIFKCKDEWYYITSAGYGYYKCDQINGVIDCLNHEFRRTA